MKRIWAAAVVVALGCSAPPPPTGPTFYADNLRDIHTWDKETAAKGHYAYDAMIMSDPADAVPVLIAKLNDKTPTAINDGLHEPVPVCTVAFHLLMKIFTMKPEAFDREGVWVMASDPSKNPIYMVKFRDDETRERLAKRFHELGVQRGWVGRKP